MMLYFAYGSNMDEEQMTARCPSAEFIAVACLPEHRLVLPRFSQGRGCGVASVEPAPGEDVWGVVFQISAAEMAALDGAEGFIQGRPLAKNAYLRTTVRVLTRQGDKEMEQELETYIANPQPNPPKPNATYMRHILNGAERWGLPSEYIRKLREIEVGK